MARVELAQLVRDLDRLAEALESLLGCDPLRAEPLGLAGLLEHRPAFGEVVLRGPAALSGSGERVAVPFQLSQCELALLDGGLRLGDRFFGNLEPAGVLRALRVELVDRPLELALRPGRAAVGPADRGLEAVAERGLVAVEVRQLVMPDRGGRAEECLRGDAAQLGEGLVGEGRVRDDVVVDLEPDRAFRPAERLLDPAWSAAVVV